MSKKDMILMFFAAAFLAVAGFVFINNQGSTKSGEGLDRLEHYTCQNESCHAEFSLNLAELNEVQVHPETGMPVCPTCSEYTVTRAYPCPECGKHLKLFGHGQMPDICPNCGERILEPRPGSTDDPSCSEPIPSDASHAPPD